MSKWLKRSLSLLMALVMVVGVLPTGLTARAEEIDPKKDLGKADGIVWFTKNKEGNNVSDEFSAMVVNDLMLDDMVREALGIEDETTKVYYNGVDVGDVWSLIRNQDTIEKLVEEMKDSISNQYPVTFTVGDAKKVIAFRNLHAAEITVGDNNKIYIDHTGAPEDAGELELLVANALNNAKVSVSHTGTVVATGIKQEVTEEGSPAIRYEGTDIVLSDRQTYEGLVAKWPTISASPDLDTKKAGTVTVTVYAAEYQKNQDEQFKKTVTVDVYMRDQNRATIKVRALALHNGSVQQDKELKDYEYTCQAYVGSTLDSQKLAPVLENYTHIGWSDQAPSQVTGDATYFAVMKPKTDNNKNGLADQNEQFTVTYISVSGNDVNVIAEHVVNYGSDTPDATKPKAPEGKKYIWNVYDEETGDAVGPWQAKVYGEVTYVAVLLEGPNVTGTFKMRDTVY